MEHVE
jgi:transposase InsO family protein